MFDNLKGLAGLAGVLKDLPKIKAKLEETRRRLGDMTVTGESGEGTFVVTANGLLRVVSIRVDQPLLDSLISGDGSDDWVSVEELMVEAVNAALDEARQLAEREMARAADELGFPLPPGGLSGMLS